MRRDWFSLRTPSPKSRRQRENTRGRSAPARAGASPDRRSFAPRRRPDTGALSKKRAASEDADEADVFVGSIHALRLSRYSLTFRYRTRAHRPASARLFRLHKMREWLVSILCAGRGLDRRGSRRIRGDCDCRERDYSCAAPNRIWKGTSGTKRIVCPRATTWLNTDQAAP